MLEVTEGIEVSSLSLYFRPRAASRDETEMLTDISEKNCLKVLYIVFFLFLVISKEFL